MPGKEVSVVLPPARLSKCKSPHYRAPNVVSESADVRKNQKRHASPLPAAQNKRAKIETEIRVANAKQKPQKAIVAAKPVLAQAGSAERYLRADPFVDVRGPTLVVCRLCGRGIKLKKYSRWHWNRHISSCKPKHAEESARLERSQLGHKNEKETFHLTESTPPLAIRVVSGSTPLKLKISYAGLCGGHQPAATDAKSGASPSSSPGLVRHNDVSPSPTSPTQRSASHQKLAPSQSTVSIDSVMTPPDLHEVPAVQVASPSCGSSLDEVEDSIMEDGFRFTESDRKWTDGDMTTSPQELTFGERLEDSIGPAASQSNVQESNAETRFDVPGVSATRNVTTVEAVNDTPLLNILPASESLAVQSSDNVPSSTSPHHSPESGSDLDFEYPDWEPPASSGVFENELQADGISLKNITRYLDSMENMDHTQHSLYETSRRLRPTVTA